MFFSKPTNTDTCAQLSQRTISSANISRSCATVLVYCAAKNRSATVVTVLAFSGVAFAYNFYGVCELVRSLAVRA